jgi:enoyl-CoA hydratase/carnithine racemase
MSEPGSSVTVRAERAGRLLTITLDRPGQANALDMSTACQLRDAVRLIDDGVGSVRQGRAGVAAFTAGRKPVFH